MTTLELTSSPRQFSVDVDAENSGNSYNNSFRVPDDQCSSMLEPKDVCEEVLGNKMAALELNDISGRVHIGDGSDSGVDIATTLNVGLQRALSSNSGGYASSNDIIAGLDESNLNGNASCDSSMISYSSDVGDTKTVNTSLAQNSNYECASENGSESSSVTGGPTIRKSNMIKKKVALFEPLAMKESTKVNTLSPASAVHMNRARSRVASVTRTPSVPRPSPPMLNIRDRARSREKTPSTASSKNITPPYRSTPVRKPQKPDSLPSALNSTPNIQRIIQRTPSLTRARTPGTPSDDGRWPSIGGKGLSLAPKRGNSATPELASLKSRVSMMSLDAKATPSNQNIYGTLPRRRKQKSVEDLTGRSSRSSSTSRENRMMTSSVVVSTRKSLTTFRESTPSKMLPPSVAKIRKVVPKTKIYHETSVQTVMTSKDVDNAFNGVGHRVNINEVELSEKETQSDIRDKEMERLKVEVDKLKCKQVELNDKLIERTQKISSMEQLINREREEKIVIQRELHLNSARVIGMLEIARGTPTEENNCDSLLMLESQIQMSGHELIEKQGEINKLHRICRSLQTEMERSLVAQECLMREKATLERESNELQDFLQNEKTAMCDALKESEIDFQECQKKLEEKEEEVKVLRDECRHLVRLNEQRRQENKAMQSKYAALEAKSKDLIFTQGSAVSGASLALTGLHTRLDSLVEQLISSYNISEQDLEDVVFHNEAYPNSGSSCNISPENENFDGVVMQSDQQKNNDGSLSPQRNQSFIAAVISAIKHATISTTKKSSISRLKKVAEVDNSDGDDSEMTEMIDSETEPCLMMDNVLEDVPIPDSHSHNMVSSTGMMISQIEVPSELIHVGDDSLHNLSQAIANRQQIELQINSMTAQKVAQFRHIREENVCDDVNSCHDSVAEMPSISDYCSGQGVVDQVIEVDNLVTKLLKVLRLIQMDNDNCIQHLIVDKNKLQLNKEELLERIKDIQDVNLKLQDELMDATQELMLKANDLSSNKAEIQRHRNEIDRLSEDICQLSTFCSQNNSESNSLAPEMSKDTILDILKTWQDQGYLLEPEIITFILSVCKEIPLLHDNVSYVGSNKQFTNYMHENSIEENKRQYQAIDKALDILHSLQTLVQGNPALIQLQRDLEEANFQSATTLPLYSAFLNNSTLADEQSITPTEDLNANGSPLSLQSPSRRSFSCNNSGNQTQINSPA